LECPKGKIKYTFPYAMTYAIQDVIETRLRSTLKKCFGRYHFTFPYRISVTIIANDI